jgi:hypothetical protein
MTTITPANGGFRHATAMKLALPSSTPVGRQNLRRDAMKILTVILFGGALLATPALAQDEAKKDDMAKKPEVHHMVSHKTRYKRDIKTDQEEHQATEDLNKQYRGVNSADVH